MRVGDRRPVASATGAPATSRWQFIRPLLSLRFAPGIGEYLTGGIVLLIVALMTLTTLLDVRDKRSDARQALVDRGMTLAIAASNVLDRSLQSRNIEALGDLSLVMWGQADIAYVKIFDVDGQLLVGPGEDQFPPPGIREPLVLDKVRDLHTKIEFKGDYLDVVSPVSVGAQLVGAIQFGFSTARIDDEIEALTLNRIWQTLILVLLGVLGSVVLSNYFAHPIRLLVGATQRIAGGDLAARVGRLRGREMHDLGSSFNSMADELEQMVAALQESRLRIVTGEDRVRREIASHLHGPVQGRLLALRAQLGEVQKREGLPEEASRSLNSIIEEMGRVIQSEIAVLSHRLYPAIVRRGLIPSLQSLCDEFESTLKLELKFPPELSNAERANSALFPEQIRLAAYRISNEALTNVVKHAASGRVTLSIGLLESGWLTVSVADDGPGFDTRDEFEGLGLSTMRDYAEAVGGTCTILSRPGGGTRVIARLPVSQD